MSQITEISWGWTKTNITELHIKTNIVESDVWLSIWIPRRQGTVFVVWKRGVSSSFVDGIVPWIYRKYLSSKRHLISMSTFIPSVQTEPLYHVILTKRNIKTKWSSVCMTPISATWQRSQPTWKNTAATVAGGILIIWVTGIVSKGVVPMLQSTNFREDSTKCLHPFSIIWKSLTSWCLKKIVSTPGLSSMTLKRSSPPSCQSNLPLVWNGCENTNPSQSVWLSMSPDSKMPSASWMPIQKSTDREHDDMHGFHCRLGLPQCRIAMGVCNRRLGRSDWKIMMNWKMMNWKDSLTRKGRVLSHYGNAPVRNWLDCWVPSTSIVDRFPCSDSTVPSTTSTWSNLNLFLGCDETSTRTKIMTVKTLVKSASSRRGRRTHTSEHAASSFSVSASTWLVGCPIRPSSKPTKFRKPNFIFLKHGSITLPNWIFPLCILTTVFIRNWNRGTCSKWETKKIMMMSTMEMSMTRMTKYSMQDNIVSYMTFGEIEAWPHFVVSWSITSIWMSVLLYKQWKKCKKKFRSPHRPVQGGCLRSGHCSSMAIPEGTCCQNQLWFHTTSRQRSLLNHQAEHRRGSKHHIHLRCRGGTHFRPERFLLSLHQYHRIWCKWALPRLHRQRHAMQRVCQTKCSGLQARLSTLLLRHVPLDELSHGNGGGPYSPCTQSHQRSSHQSLSCGRLRPQHEDRVRIQQVLFSRKLSLQEKSR